MTASEVDAAREICGANELPRANNRTLIKIVVETFKEPMFALLLLAAGLYLILGELGEGVFLLLGALASIGLIIWQEARSERALEALRELSSPLVTVVREGREEQIPAQLLVPGDTILIAEGARVPADATLLYGDPLRVDESLLTGESVPAIKHVLTPDQVEDAAANLFAGTLVVSGQGVGRVTAIGAQSTLGKLGSSLKDIREERTPLQRTTGRLVALMGVIAISFCIAVFVAFVILRDDWFAGALAGVTVAIALIPEEFPMVLAIFMAFGAWRLAMHNVLVRRSAAVETLGAVTMLCVDKTGTLTHNKMQIVSFWSEGEMLSTDKPDSSNEKIRRLAELARLASSPKPVDPMDRAAHALAETVGTPEATTQPSQTWPLSADRMAFAQAWTEPDGRVAIAMKGAPETVCQMSSLSNDEVDKVMGIVSEMAGDGLRVLGMASASCENIPPVDLENATFKFEGLIGFLDPLRADVPAALQVARDAQIGVLMITGDHPATACAIAKTAGIDTSFPPLTGVELETLSDEDLTQRLAQTRVCARITPEQKLRIVTALRENNHVVGMTGDGMNDAPALKAAHVGIAMGQKGTDIAREASDIVLVDDAFDTIVGGVQLGRRIYRNLQRALVFIAAVHVPIAGLALLPILLGLPQFLFPMHVVLLELAIDPICALVFEGERSDKDAMKRPPRDIRTPMFGHRLMREALLEGGMVLAAVLGLYAWAVPTIGENAARGLAFAALVTGNLTLALVSVSGHRGNLFDKRRVAFWVIVGVIIALLIVLFSVPTAAAISAFTTPPLIVLVGGIALAVLAGGWSWVLPKRRAGVSKSSGTK